MSNLLGVIKTIVGQVYVMEADGSQRLLKEGDRIYSGEEVITGSNGAVSVALSDGRILDLGRNSQWGENGLHTVNSDDHNNQDVASLQNAIASGEDPTKSFEAPAAGNEPTVQIEGGGGGHTLLQLELTGQIVNPTAGFKTRGIGEPEWERRLPDSGVAASDSAGALHVLPPVVHIDDFAGNDGYVSKNEINHASVSGTSNQNHVTLIFTDSQKNTLIIDVAVTDGHWAARPDLSQMVEGRITVEATATDVSGRTAQVTSVAVIDTIALHDSITIDSVTPDNVINIAESHNRQTLIHGIVAGDAKIGDKVILLVDGQTYTNTVIDLGNGKLGYQINVSTQGLLSDPHVQATVTSTDAAGNTSQASTRHHVDIDLDIHNTVTIGTVADDNIVNSNEARMPVMITGFVGGDAKAGDQVTVTVGGHDTHGVVVSDNGQLRYEVVVPTNRLREGENDVHVQVISHDAAGNEAIATEHKIVTLDRFAHNELSINTVAGDDVVNAMENRMPTFISGVVTGDSQAGDPVVVSVNGLPFYGTVSDENGTLRYNVAVPNGTLNEGRNDVEVMVSGVDSSGNSSISVAYKTITLDTQADNFLTIGTVAGDNTVNAIENRMPTVISGDVAGDAQSGDRVIVTVNGMTFYGKVVDDNGHLRYAVPLPGHALGEGHNNVQVMVVSHDMAGNEAIAVEHKNVTLDTYAFNAVDIRTVSGDNVVNAAESQHDTYVTGVVSGKDARAGDRVVVHVNEKDFVGEAFAHAGGQLQYKIAVTPGVLLDGDNDVLVTVTSHDKAGNEAIAVAHHNVVLDTHADATISVDAVTKDNVLNHDELDAKQWVHGSVGGDARPGDRVDIDIRGQHFTGDVIVLNDGSLGYRIPVDAGALGNNGGEVNADLRFTVSVTAHDKAGNVVTQTTEHTVHLDNHAENAVVIRTVSGDNVVNAAESQHDTFITGVVSGKDARAGDRIVVQVQGQSFAGRVVEDGHGQLHYKVAISSGLLQEGDNDVLVNVISHDKVGNEAIALAHQNVVLDTHADASVSVDRVTKDNTLSHAEMNAQKQIISGTVGGDARRGDVVTLDINGHKFIDNVVDLGDGTLGYKISVDPAVFGDNHAMIDGDIKFTASVTSHDAAHNEVTVITEHTVHIDNFASNEVHIGTVAGDNIINMNESRLPTLISGNVGGDAQAGDPVVITVNGRDYAGEVAGVAGHLYYSVPVPTSVLHEGKNNVKVMLTSHDHLGNEAVAYEHRVITVDRHAHNEVTIGIVAGDDTVNAHESAEISGTVRGDAQAGDPVVISVNGNSYTGLVSEVNGHLGYHVTVPHSALVEGKNDVQVMVTGVDNAGNTAIAVEHKTIILDSHAYNALNIDTVDGDNIVNASESRMPMIISGKVSGDVHAGDPVVVSVNGHTVNGVVVVDNGHLRYEVAVPTHYLREGKNDVQVTVTGNDDAGNMASSVEHHQVTLDRQAHATISIGAVTNDNVLNYSELETPKQTLTGIVGGDAKVGDDVVLKINGYHYSGHVVELPDHQLGYSIAVDSYAFSDNRGHIDSGVKVTATVTSFDHVQNEVIQTTEHIVHIDNHADVSITVDPVTGDDIINHSESREHFTKVSGTVSGEDVHAGDKVVVTVNGRNYETVVASLAHQNGALGYNVDVLTRDMLADPHHTITVHITGQDAAGNRQLVEASKELVVDLNAEATITIDPVTANHDNIINAAESGHEFTTITGTVSGDAKEGDLVTLHVNGLDLTGRVDANLHYSIDVSTYDLMSDPHLRTSISVTDNANNTALIEAKQDIVVDTHVDATITVDPVTADNTLNDEELNHRFTLVTGNVTGEMHVGDPLTLTVNNHVYHGTVEDLGNNQMGYRIAVETTDIHSGDHKIYASIGVTDAAQNSAVVAAEHLVGIDDHADATVTINIISGDDVLNQLDQSSPTTVINGLVTGNINAGEFVHLTVNGHTYDVEVKPQAYLDNKLGYSFAASTADLLADPHIVATVNASDAAGNTITAGATHDVSRDDRAYATITIDSVTDDNVINNTEAHQEYTTVTGLVSGDVHSGDRVELIVNGQHYFGCVSDQGGGLHYSIDVSTADLISGDSKPVIHASVMGYDAAGNTVLAESDHTINIDTRADAEIKVGSLTLNGSRDFWVIEGTVGGDAKEGDVVKIFANGKTYETAVQKYSDGHLGFNGDRLIDAATGNPVYINAHDLDNNADVRVEITSTDPYGNSETASAQIHANVPWPATSNNGTVNNGNTTTLPHNDQPHAVITLNPVAGNDIINQSDSQSPHTVIRGTVSGDVNLGDEVTLHIGKDSYTGYVTERPNLPGEYGYEISVDTQNLINHPDITATVTAHNDHGSQIVTVSKPLIIDTDVSATIKLDDIAGDNVINSVESRSGTTTVSGTVTGDNVHTGSNVTLTVNGHQITTQVFEDASHVLRFSKEISIDDLRHDPVIAASVTGNDDHGNVMTVTDGKTIAVDTDVKATVTINSVTDDNVLNLSETKSPVTQITGTVSGDVNPGEYVTLTVNNHKYHAKIAPDMTYKADIRTVDLLAEHRIDAKVTGNDTAQNSIDAFADRTIGVDTTASATITINTVSGDNILSAKDLSSQQTEISGVVGGDARIGDDVKIMLNGHLTVGKVIELPGMNGQPGYTMKVDTADLKAELTAELKAHPTDTPTITVTVSGTDDAGNSFSQRAVRAVAIDDHADVELHINKVSDDNVLNLDDSQKPTTEISGTVTGDVHAGNNVIVHVNGNDLNAIIEHGPSGELTFKVRVNTSELLQNPEITYTVTGVDAVGNTVTLCEANKLIIDQHAENSIHVNTIAGDGKVNFTELMSGKTAITGSVQGDVHVGDTVTLAVNGHTYTGIIVEHTDKHHSSLTYDIPVDSNVLNEGENSVTVTVSGKDAAGNTATSTTTQTVTLDTHADASISMDPVASDNIINAAESGHISVSGVVDGDAKDGDIVTLLVNGHAVQTKVVTVGNHLGYDVEVKKGWLHEGDNDFTVSVRATDDAGNKVTPAWHQNVVLDTHADATIIVNKVTGDNRIDWHEARNPFNHITGFIDGDVHKGDHVSATINGKQYDARLHETHGHLSYDIPVQTDSLLSGHNDVIVSVMAHDDHGNVTRQSQHVDVIVDAPIHHGKQEFHIADKNHHAARHESGLGKLFDDNHDSFAFNFHHGEAGQPDEKGHSIFTGKESGEHGKVDLSDLAHELHEIADITLLMKVGETHHGTIAAAPANPGHAGDTSQVPLSDSHVTSTYSLDHLIAKPENYSH
ncbi:retention module-containing protein [Citrobacter sp. Cm046]|uniref:retention module-containing protein n=1 Tax=Citrobacter sp. Cm046 TaxID=2985118 RepID=UPI0025775050|nr:retention module-containing protein [Citrobacter sp. Cm046]MDM2928947.1 retention module-containing protein [Citrobacter sp. Cm046]